MILNALDSEHIAQIVFTIATPKALRAILQTNEEIKAVRKQILNNPNAQIEIEEFVRDRLIDLKPKRYFPHEPAFCALAVAIENLPVPMAEKFLNELAELKIAEMPMSSRVAVLCLQRRRELLIGETEKHFRVKPLALPKGPSLVEPHCIPTESITHKFKVAA